MEMKKNTRKNLLLLAFNLGLIIVCAQVSYAAEEVKYVREITEGLQEPVDSVVNVPVRSSCWTRSKPRF